MEINADDKEKIAKKVVESMLHAFENDHIKDYELPAVSRLFLQRIELAKTQDDLIDMLEDMASEWGFFAHLLTIEKGRISEKVDKQDVEKILELTKEGKIDEALGIAKAANQN